MSIPEDIEKVRQALGTAAEAGDLSGGPDAFERIVAELERLRLGPENADMRLAEYEEAREVGE